MVYNNGKPYEQMDDLGGKKPTYFRKHPPWYLHLGSITEKMSVWDLSGKPEAKAHLEEIDLQGHAREDPLELADLTCEKRQDFGEKNNLHLVVFNGKNMVNAGTYGKCRLNMYLAILRLNVTFLP